MKNKAERPITDKDQNIIRQKWPELSPAEKWKYILSYYGTAIAVVILAFTAAVFLIRDIRREKVEDAFYVMAVGLPLTDGEAAAMEQELSEILDLDPETQRCRIEAGYSGNANMQSEATISTYMRSGQVDLVIAPEEVFNRYAAAGYLSPLKDCGLKDLEEQCPAEALFYAEAIDYSQGGAVEDVPFHPHEITESADCYGICLQDGIWDRYAAGVMINSPHREHISAGMQYFIRISGHSVS